MQQLDQSIAVGGTFRMKGRIKNSLTGQYLDFTGSTMNLYVQSDKGVYLPSLTATSDGLTPTITFESNGTVFNAVISPANTAGITAPWMQYTLWVTWPNGDEVPLVGGRLTPFIPVKP